MAPVPLISLLSKRDASSLSAGAIAGIIVGIVVVAAILLAVFIWQLLAYRKNLDPYNARSLDSRAREKALFQTRGEHVRSTRPQDHDGMALDERRRLVKKQSQDQDIEEEEVMAEGQDVRSHNFDSSSVNATVRDEDDVVHIKGKLNEKRADQERDMEIYQGHHARPSPLSNQGFSNEAAVVDNDNEPDAADTPTKQSTLRGCTTM